MPEEELEEGAQYGALPFDYYVTVRPTFLGSKVHIKILCQLMPNRNIGPRG